MAKSYRRPIAVRFKATTFFDLAGVRDEIEKIVAGTIPAHPRISDSEIQAAMSLTPKGPDQPAPPPILPVTAAPASTSAPSPTPDSALAPANPSPNAVKPWTPPDVMPAQPNWKWETSDGKTYQNVVVTKIEADTVSITHSTGAAHIPINLLPPDIQKQLGHDPHATEQTPP